jgi:hypothetical protein
LFWLLSSSFTIPRITIGSHFGSLFLWFLLKNLVF